MTDDKTTGAWLVHHAQKLASVDGAGRLDNITYAGKAIVLLSALSESDRSSDIDQAKLEAIAAGCKIHKKTELPALLQALEKQKLIDLGTQGGCSVLGITTETALTHGAEIFRASNPTREELATIAFAEQTSLAPMQQAEAVRFVDQVCGIGSADRDEFLELTTGTGLIDKEGRNEAETVYFNGNIFRRNYAARAALILSSLTPPEQAKVKEVDDRITTCGCLELPGVKAILGDALWGKLHAIGYFDQITVENDSEVILYVARPASFSKYGNALVDDALDLAKIFTASLTYGMTRSAHGRGRITMITALMHKLISGQWVGPATAIGHDYQILEMRRVVELQRDQRGMYKMRLLKKEIGNIALAAISTGMASETTLSLSGASITTFSGPEKTRYAARKIQIPQSKRETRDILDMLRTGV
jgi:hypothetical protein